MHSSNCFSFLFTTLFYHYFYSSFLPFLPHHTIHILYFNNPSSLTFLFLSCFYLFCILHLHSFSKNVSLFSSPLSLILHLLLFSRYMHLQFILPFFWILYFIYRFKFSSFFLPLLFPHIFIFHTYSFPLSYIIAMNGRTVCTLCYQEIVSLSLAC